MSFPYLAALSDRAVTVEYSSSKTFRPGQMGMTEDGSMFRLCKAGAAITSSLSYNVTYENFQGGVTGTCVEGALTTAIVAGDTYCELTDATNARAKDYYKDGYVCQPRSESADNIRRILSSDAEATNMYRLHVSAPFTIADAVGNTINVYTCKYKDVRDGGSAGPLGTSYDSVIGYNNHAVTSGAYFWGKVRGPHWCWIFGTWPGAAARDRAVCAYPGGTIIPANDSWATYSDQYIGRLMYADNYGDDMIYLELE